MRRIVTLSLVLAMGGGCTLRDEPGPSHGLWRLDTGANEGWFCARGGASCSPPAYFSPAPMEVVLRSGGVLDWSGGVRHTGMVDGACIRVPAGTDDGGGGVLRTELTFCNLVDGSVVDEDRAFVQLGWSPGTADECTCSAHFDFVGG